MDLVEFLTARLDEDERVARDARPAREDPSSGTWIAYTHDPGPADLQEASVALVGAVPDDPSSTGGMDWAVCEAGQGVRAGAISAHLALHDPTRVLAEVDAKRRIVDEHPNVNDGDCGACVKGHWGYPTHGGSSPERWPCPTLRLLALPYAEHPDYDEAWRP
ncbi:DUF6221 family protein [Streptomyces sp. NPDC006339]|uniref:DUF6221 family protein n=1 Tax=Streptomyces sp. NPDC006339 TaxID=3156755 RepID=UPI0033B28241